ncbi:hypothetical protein B0H13DRAFT_2113809 [Mycena leptocephala]|nr:hypothetical protein B0H13DRAFT_2113809 [Mycena leptocephala]
MVSREEFAYFLNTGQHSLADGLVGEPGFPVQLGYVSVVRGRGCSGRNIGGLAVRVSADGRTAAGMHSISDRVADAQRANVLNESGDSGRYSGCQGRQTRLSFVGRRSVIWGDGRGRNKVRHAVVRLGVRCVRWVVSSDVGVNEIISVSVHVDVVDLSRVRIWRIFKGKVHSVDARTGILSCTAVGCLRSIALLHFCRLLGLETEDRSETDINLYPRDVRVSTYPVAQRPGMASERCSILSLYVCGETFEAGAGARGGSGRDQGGSRSEGSKAV